MDKDQEGKLQKEVSQANKAKQLFENPLLKESFDKLLVGILMNMVQKDVAKEVRVEHDNTDGESDIDESFERRVFYKIDNPVPEG